MIPAWLVERLREAGPSPALIWRDRTYSHSWLLDRSVAWGKELAERGVSRGAVIALRGDYSPESVAALLALLEGDHIAVPISAAAPNPERLVEIARAEHILDLREEADRLHSPTSTRTPHPLVQRLRAAGEPGLVLFTSGSTGEPKGALHSFPLLLGKFREQRPARRTLTFLLLDHIGGINTLFHILSNGGTVVTISERGPESVCAAIERHGVELLPTTPTFLNLLLLSGALERYDLSSLRQITYGTEPMPLATLERLHSMLPEVRLSQTYGLSELGILRVRSRSSDSLWLQLGGENVETKIVDGILKIRTPTAMLGYLNSPSPFDDEGWFDTQDEVEVDGEWIRFRGRRSEIINVGGQKVYPAEVENVLLRMTNVSDVVVRGEPHPVTGQIVAARFVLASPEPLDVLRRRVREHCRVVLAPFQVPARIEVAEGAQHSARFKKLRSRENAD